MGNNEPRNHMARDAQCDSVSAVTNMISKELKYQFLYNLWPMEYENDIILHLKEDQFTNCRAAIHGS